ncbi:bifunctional (p)ppGpp synthetase/guanosine-3',5'-bis(diphosphate) 3'-pyrophosphohydrolase [Candidatus Kaiserbacteria bacterium]|nr:bifunctional (p)ppGpp synthetase/guanosine-3',5'-bis(diphosphate) 3'-pyrophosphohydrolase [Candidatus Kaiserbacteria bacterium]
MTTVKEILGKLRGASEAEQKLVERAYDFAKSAHEGHTRYSGEPYFIHPAAVAKILAEYGMDATTITAGLLHDAVEDACTTREAVEKEFGKEVLFIVDGVTKLGTHKYRGVERHAESLRRLLVATASDIRVLIVKLADRYHNMETLQYVPAEKQKRIALETLEIYAPIADRLGMGLVKRELEDLAFPYVDPDAQTHALEVRKLKNKETETGLAKVQKELRRELAKKGIKNFRTEIRTKGLWSLHQKLKRKGDDITQIHDINALRVVVGSVDDCYSALGVIHALWRPLPGEFKDYIAFEKPNGYQSLHTTVLTKEAGIVEIQVRTEEMHKNAQFGIASHMSYKQLGKKIEKADKTTQKNSFASLSLSWIRGLVPSLMKVKPAGSARGSAAALPPRWLAELASAHAEVAGSKEFVEGLKEDFFSHRVFVFTPEGDVIDLPAGATPIDFAYAIHSGLGNHLQGALGNGDVVEILEREAAHPSAKWLEHAKTSLARKHIRAALGMGEESKGKPKEQKKPRAPRAAKKK